MASGFQYVYEVTAGKNFTHNGWGQIIYNAGKIAQHGKYFSTGPRNNRILLRIQCT